MGIEIERKFLVKGDDWRNGLTGIPYRQGYLSGDQDLAIRVRIAGSEAFLTIKGPNRGITRSEFEYEIPMADAEAMLTDLCLKPQIEKMRFSTTFEGHLWVIDEFFGENSGLIVAEIELEDESQPFALPPWAGKEVSDDARYFNVNLIRHPWSQWR